MCTDVSPSAHAAEVKDHVVMLRADVQQKAPRITLRWIAHPGATGYAVYRRIMGQPDWGTAMSLPAEALEFADKTAKAATAYEYKVVRSGPVEGYGYACAGLELPLVESRGKLVLIVDDTHAAELASELKRLERDLVGDGWTVLRHDVPRTDTPAAVKALILKDVKADPKGVRAVFLFGHVPVPLSGLLSPDGHEQRPWPADLYYGDVTGAWTDEKDMGPANVPGDGKFDPGFAVRRRDRAAQGDEQPREGRADGPRENRRREDPGHLPADVALQVGRVDLYDLPAFAPKTETDLLREYLNKNHNYRHKVITVPRRGLIDDNFGEFNGEAFAQSGWRCFAPLVGPENIAGAKWNDVLPNERYLWAYGCGPGSHDSCGGVTNAGDLARLSPQVIFTMLFGSYFGEWNSTNNVLRAPLASGYTLTCAWAGRPHWFLHPMAMGETIGSCARLAQNNSRTQYLPAGRASRSVHIALMGDPALRMHVVAPPGNLKAATGKPGSVELSWNPSPDQATGYNIYRAKTPDGPFEKLTRKPITATTFKEKRLGPKTYMVRTVALETSPTGTYYNASQGVFVTPEE
ncbi:MAG TPA: fibronectin type III domain-containing protein [Planctomycetota bacterium]|nr:fibronectin type III domain-containing protein [Planctomycetota bacterium]